MLDFVNLTEGYESLLSVQNKIWFLDLVLKDLHKLTQQVNYQVLVIHPDDSYCPYVKAVFHFVLSKKDESNTDVKV